VGVPAWPLHIIRSINVYNRVSHIIIFCYVLGAISEPIGIQIINLRSFLAVLQFHGELLQLFGRVFHLMKFLFVHCFPTYFLVHETQAEMEGILAKLTFFVTINIADLMTAIVFDRFINKHIFPFSSLDRFPFMEERIFLV